MRSGYVEIYPTEGGGFSVADSTESGGSLWFAADGIPLDDAIVTAVRLADANGRRFALPDWLRPRPELVEVTR